MRSAVDGRTTRDGKHVLCTGGCDGMSLFVSVTVVVTVCDCGYMTVIVAVTVAMTVIVAVTVAMTVIVTVAVSAVTAVRQL